MAKEVAPQLSVEWLNLRTSTVPGRQSFPLRDARRRESSSRGAINQESACSHIDLERAATSLNQTKSPWGPLEDGMLLLPRLLNQDLSLCGLRRPRQIFNRQTDEKDANINLHPFKHGGWDTGEIE